MNEKIEDKSAKIEQILDILSVMVQQTKTMI